MIYTINAQDKLILAKNILVNYLQNKIKSYSIRSEKYELVMTFTTGIKLYIRYNDFNEYGYNIIFSSIKFDRIRYDNFDNRWSVISRPHHKHPRSDKIGVESPMIGDPNKDIPELVKTLKNFL